MDKKQLNLIKSALLAVEKLEIQAFEALPEVRMVHSEEYNRNIATLMQKTTPVSKWSAKKIATVLIAATLIFALSITAFAFRESIKEFFVEIYEDFAKITADENENEEPLPTKIENVYTVHAIPEGYVSIIDTADDTMVQQGWMNDTKAIAFQQVVAKDSEISADIGDAEYTETQIGGISIFLVQKYDVYALYWIKNGYSFYLMCPDSIEWTKVEEMVLSIAPK